MFFSGCNLRCAFCQNHDIAHRRSGFDLTPEQLADWYVKLQEVGGVHNINLVTPEHVVPQVALSILAARDLGLRVPIVYNTSAFDSAASLALLDGLVDIYLPDFKVWEASSSRRLLKADDYAAAARESVAAMQRQVGDLCFTGDGIARRGLLVRHLVMPGREAEGARIMRFLAEHVSRDVFVHIMEQYRPDAHVGKPRRRQQRAGSGKATGDGNDGGERDEGGQGGAAAGDKMAEVVGEEKKEEVRYADINRAVSKEEISIVRKAAEEAGIWRFCDPPRHEGFAI